MPKARGWFSKLEGDFAVICCYFSHADHSGIHFFAAGYILNHQEVIRLYLHGQANKSAMSVHYQGMPNL